ncbi:MAG: hypothetical protein Q4D89_00360 [Arachnia propionica]|uniref:hypothetical protein n=1 Tax=Arachnia propionica TaxID=1750 RepID=UPI0026FA2269|nr:hypothetical protein [Arachnia propionica]
MSAPRLVVVHRRTELEELVERHSTLGGVEFFLESRGQRIETVVAADQAHRSTLAEVMALTPDDWRSAVVERSMLSRFLFEVDDLVVVVGQDGLVANVAKYLTGQLVVGINPQGRGPLCRHTVGSLGHILAGAAGTAEERWLVEVVLDDGQRLRALNEVYIGDRGHQSSRYVLEVAGEREEQSSSGVIVGTGTGASGWLVSLWRQHSPGFSLPGPGATELAYFVREAWPLGGMGTDLVHGLMGDGEEIALVARGRLVVFGDGLESDFLRLEWGQRLVVRRAEVALRLA